MQVSGDIGSDVLRRRPGHHLTGIEYDESAILILPEFLLDAGDHRSGICLNGFRSRHRAVCDLGGFGGKQFLGVKIESPTAHREAETAKAHRG